ncbi:MAG: hypothetical protein WCJ85_12465 [Chitinophagaceae bacterium]
MPQYSIKKLDLPEGAIASLRLLEDNLFLLQLLVSDLLEFETNKHIILNNTVVVPKGCKASEKATEAAPRKIAAKARKLNSTIDHLNLANGKVKKIK